MRAHQLGLAVGRVHVGDQAVVARGAAEGQGAYGHTGIAALPGWRGAGRGWFKIFTLGGYQVSENVFLYPVTAPALIIVGSLMLKNVVHINWRDYTESIPAFLTLVIMPLTFSITEGIAFGFISYSVLKLLSGRGKEVHWMIYLFGGLFVFRYIFLTA